MANFSKKWGTVIACWCVALVMIVAGICMGLTIPSNAAEPNEGDIAVIFDANGDGVIGEDETTVYHTMKEAIVAAYDFDTTAQKPVTMRLLSDVTSGQCTIGAANDNGNTDAHGGDIILDLNGYVLAADYFSMVNYDHTLKIIDSRPETVHYFAYVGNGEYEYVNEKFIGYDATVYGGVIVSNNNPDAPSIIYNMATENDAQLILDGGTYLGNCLVMSGAMAETVTARIEINEGVNWQFCVKPNSNELTGKFSFLLSNSKMDINGGIIYGQIATVDDNDETEVIDFNNLPDNVTVNPAIKIEESTIDGVKVYTAVDADGNPTTKPITATEQPTNNNNNLIGLIILAVAAAVMVVGVTVIIIVNAKRRKKVA